LMEKHQQEETLDLFAIKLWKRQKIKNHGLVMNKNTFYLDKKVATHIGHLVSQEEVMPHHKVNTIVPLVLKTPLEEPSQKLT